MNFHTVAPLLSAILVFTLGVLVFKYSKKPKVNKIFGVFSLMTTIWMLGTFMMFINRDSTTDVIFWDKIVYFGVIFIPITMYHFGLAVTNYKIIRNNILVYIGYAIAFFFIALLPTDNFIAETFVYKWGAHSKAQFFHHIFLVYFSFYILLWLYVVATYYKVIYHPQEKERIKYLLIAFAQYIIFGPLGFLPAYGIGIYPFAYFTGVIFSIITAYAIITRGLMDIKLVLRKYSVYLSALILTLLPVLVLKYLARNYFPGYAFWFDILLLAGAISLFPVLRNWFYKIANKYFFTSLYDSKKVIASLSDKLSSTLSTKKVYQYVHDALSNSMHVKALAVLVFDKKGENLKIGFNKGFECDNKKIPVAKHKDVYERFVRRDKVIIFEELSRYKGKDVQRFVKEYNKDLGVEILVPLVVKDKHIGVLALGPKETADIYNKEDIEVLRVISSQVAIALENANLYQETKNFNVKLKKEVDKATKELKEANEELRKLDEAKSEFISIASHQLRTPLTVIKGYVSMTLEGSFGKLENAVDENLYKVYESNERLIHLVENLLNISRIESGRLQFNFEKADIEDTVASVIEELAHAAQKKKIYLNYETPKKKDIIVNMDEEKIRQVESEVKRLKDERDILKKATIYFAKQE